MKRLTKLDKISNEEFIKIVDKSSSIREIILELGYLNTGTYLYKLVNEKINELNLNFNTTYKVPEFRKVSDDEIFVENSTYKSNSLRKRILKKGLIDYKCSSCGITEWLGEPLSLHLDHINGVNNDNRLDNLRFLCPNCHSQTDTYCGRNTRIKYYCECGSEKCKKSNKCKKCSSSYKDEHNILQRKVKERPSYEELVRDINKIGYSAVGRKYGVSDNAVRKWVKVYEKNIMG